MTALLERDGREQVAFAVADRRAVGASDIPGRGGGVEGDPRIASSGRTTHATPPEPNPAVRSGIGSVPAFRHDTQCRIPHTSRASAVVSACTGKAPVPRSSSTDRIQFARLPFMPSLQRRSDT